MALVTHSPAYPQDYEGGSNGTKLASHPEGITQLEYLPSMYKALASMSSIGS